jgi:hypothetical protein
VIIIPRPANAFKQLFPFVLLLLILLSGCDGNFSVTHLFKADAPPLESAVAPTATPLSSAIAAPAIAATPTLDLPESASAPIGALPSEATAELATKLATPAHSPITELLVGEPLEP